MKFALTRLLITFTFLVAGQASFAQSKYVNTSTIQFSDGKAMAVGTRADGSLDILELTKNENWEESLELNDLNTVITSELQQNAQSRNVAGHLMIGTATICSALLGGFVGVYGTLMLMPYGGLGAVAVAAQIGFPAGLIAGALSGGAYVWSRMSERREKAKATALLSQAAHTNNGKFMADMPMQRFILSIYSQMTDLHHPTRALPPVE